MSQVLWVLLGSISILLLIACANVANLVEPGFTDPATVQTVRLSMPASMQSERLVGAQQQILERLAAIPGVTSAAYTTLLPMEGQGADSFIGRRGRREIRKRATPALAENCRSLTRIASDSRYAVTRRP